MSVEASPESDLTLVVIPHAELTCATAPVTLILAVPQDFMDAYRRGRPA